MELNKIAPVQDEGMLQGIWSCMCACADPQVFSQFQLMMWRNSIIKRRKLGELIKGWILPGRWML